jgi:hypothetical protein
MVCLAFDEGLPAAQPVRQHGGLMQLDKALGTAIVDQRGVRLFSEIC